MSDKPDGADARMTCPECEAILQDYLDGSLPKEESLRVFLHVRACEACARTLQHWQDLYQMLGELPAHTPPADFDGRVLATVPLAAYQAMAPLRRDRVPVFLTEEFLPGYLRDRRLRLGGLALAVLGGVGLAAGVSSELGAAAVGLGLLPEILVRVQGVGRRLALAWRGSEGGH